MALKSESMCTFKNQAEVLPFPSIFNRYDLSRVCNVKKKGNLKSSLHCSWNKHPLAKLQQADSLLVNVILYQYGFHFWHVYWLKTHHKTILTKWSATHLWFTPQAYNIFTTLSIKNKNKQEQSLKIIFKIADFYPSHLVSSKVKWRFVKLLLPTACSAADSQ